MLEENFEKAVEKEVPENFDELQIFIHNSLQTIIAQALDAKDYYDPFTVVTLINQISEVYLENMKSEWSKLNSDRKSYEEDIKKDLEVLAEEVV